MARIHSTPLVCPRAGSAMYWLYGALQMGGVIAATAWLWGDWPQAIASVLIARALALGFAIAAYFALSTEKTAKVLLAALNASRHALWLPAGFLFLSTVTPLGTVAGVVILANATRLFAGSPAPRRRGSLQAASSSTIGENAIASILGAIALQCAWAAWAFNSPRWAGAGAIAAAAVFTRTAIAKGAYRQKEQRSRLPYAIAIALVLRLVTPAEDAPTPSAAEPPIGSASKGALARITQGTPAKKKADPAKRATTLVPPPSEPGSSNRKDVMKGIVLRPEKIRPQATIVRPATNLAFGLNHPLTIPFTGEYHIFRTMNEHLPQGSPTQFGATPLTASFITTNGGFIETEAYQPFLPPVDFSYCSRVEVTIASKEAMPATAMLRLTAGGKTIDLGTELFGLEPAPEETLSFTVPYEIRAIQVEAMTLVFHHGPGTRNQSAKVAVRTLTLVPSGM